MNEAIKNNLKGILFVLFIIAILYFAFAGIIFQFRNPKANEVQIYAYFMDVIKFNKLEEFQ